MSDNSWSWRKESLSCQLICIVNSNEFHCLLLDFRTVVLSFAAVGKVIPICSYSCLDYNYNNKRYSFMLVGPNWTFKSLPFTFYHWKEFICLSSDVFLILLQLNHRIFRCKITKNGKKSMKSGLCTHHRTLKCVRTSFCQFWQA